MTKSKTLLPDTNTILRYFLRDNEAMFEKANAVFEEIRVGERKALVLQGVIIETIYVLTKFYKVPRKQAALNLKDLLMYRGIQNADKQELIRALEIFAESTIDIVDCILHCSAERNDTGVFSFDKDIKKLIRKYKK